jgi:hypothetical protein
LWVRAPRTMSAVGSAAVAVVPGSGMPAYTLRKT